MSQHQDQDQDHTSEETSFPTVGRWLVTALPRGWIYVANFGIRQMLDNPKSIPANVSLGQDELAQPEDLEAYLAAQYKLIQGHFEGAQLAGPQASAFQGADEAHLLFVRHMPQTECKMLHAQTYVRSGRWVGIVTLTTRESELKVVRPDYDAFIKGLRIKPASASNSNSPGRD